MSILNWIALVLAVVLWMVSQNMMHGIAMASSTVEKGSPEDMRLDRVERVAAIAAVGAVLTLICELIPIDIVKTGGIIIVAISCLSVAILLAHLAST